MKMPPLCIAALLPLALLPASPAQSAAPQSVAPQAAAQPQAITTTTQTGRILNCPVNPISHSHDCTLAVLTFDHPSTPDGRVEENGRRTELNIVGPGISLGNSGGWSVHHVQSDFLNVGTRGISQGRVLFFNKHAVGDTMGTYDYVYSDGGSTAQSDEAIKGEAVGIGENTGYFHGSIASTTGTGDTTPALKFATGNNWTTDGAPLLDISKGTLAGHITGPSAPLPGSTYLNTFPVDNVLPVTTAWGICAKPIPNNHLAQTNTPFTCDVTLKQGAFTSDGMVCVTGPNYPEQAPITQAARPSSGTQTITIAVRYPNAAGATILQGGPCGQYISFDANLDASGYRSSYYAFGASDPHHLIYGVNIRGNLKGNFLPMLGSEAEQFGVAGFNGYHLYPGCEVVANRTLGASPVCEPNAVPWAPGDLVEAPHSVSVNVVGLYANVVQNTPSNGSLSSGDEINFHGAGTSGHNFIAHRTRNINPNSFYKPYGGVFDAPDMHRIEGYFDSGIFFTEAPGTVIRVTADAAHANTPITLFALPGGSIKWDPTSGSLITKTGLRGTTGNIGGAPLSAGTCTTGTATIAGAAKTMVPVTVAANTGAPGFSPNGAFQVSAQVTAPNTVTVSVCAILPGTPHPSAYLVSLQ